MGIATSDYTSNRNIAITTRLINTLPTRTYENDNLLSKLFISLLIRKKLLTFYESFLFEQKCFAQQQ